MMKSKTKLWQIIIILCSSSLLFSQNDPYDSGGPIMPEQAAYDVKFYDLSLTVNPADSTIHGEIVVVADLTAPLQEFVLNLDPRLQVSSTWLKFEGRERKVDFEHENGLIKIAFPFTAQPGQSVSARVAYGGKPRVAPRPPWDGGFTWARTPSGAPWIATSCQGPGADLWWPNKDHPSDEPDSMALRITVPENLVVASNGVLRSVRENGDQTKTFHWFVSTPINSYTVALNIAPYRVIEDDFKSVDGTNFPVKFWLLPESYENGQKLFPEILDHLRFFEKYFGPYPFRAQKYGVAETPHLGMEHQTIIAYGAKFNNGSMTRGVDWGFDALHHHELAHEWWGNLVTCADWKDFWIHEGIGSYTQAMYVEELFGEARYHEYMKSVRGRMQNRKPLAPRFSVSAENATRDAYFKGAWMLHTLRYLVGKDAVYKALRRLAYPDASWEKRTDGGQCRFASSNDFVRLAEEASGQELDWFFEIYLREAKLPELLVERDGNSVLLTWKTPRNLPFPMPVEVQIKNKKKRVEFKDGEARISVKEKEEFVVDPDNWVLMKAEDAKTRDESGSQE